MVKPRGWFYLFIYTCFIVFQSEEEEEESEDEARYKPKKGRYLSAKQMKAPKPKLPPVSEMVIESIKALKEHPRKGSSLRDIRVS